MLDRVISEMRAQLEGNARSFYERDQIAVRIKEANGDPPENVFFDGHKYVLTFLDYEAYAYYDRMDKTTLTIMEASFVERDI